MRYTKRQYFYHVSHKSLGNNPVLKPRFGGSNRDMFGEPYVKRTCVSISPAYCFGAIPIKDSVYFIYRTKKRVRGVFPYQKDWRCVHDARITKERWLTYPVSFVKIVTLPEIVVEDMGLSIACTEETQIRKIIKVDRILKKQLGKSVFEHVFPI